MRLVSLASNHSNSNQFRIFVVVFFRQAHLKKSKQIFDFPNSTCPNRWATKDQMMSSEKLGPFLLDECEQKLKVSRNVNNQSSSSKSNIIETIWERWKLLWHRKLNLKVQNPNASIFDGLSLIHFKKTKISFKPCLCKKCIRFSWSSIDKVGSTFSWG